MGIYSLNNNSYTVTCSKNDTCYIGCYGVKSCDGMKLVCKDGSNSCFVDCDYNSTGCPIGNYSEWFSNIPTSIASKHTNRIPSDTPTDLPSQLLSQVPSFYPSSYPTTIPTTNPSLYPTTTTTPQPQTRQ